MARTALLLVMGLAAAACGRRAATPEPPATAAPAATASASAPATQAAADSPSASPSPSPAVFSVPARFTALGTEPFWAAKVTGDRVTYMTPEDQAGQAIAVARTAGADFVELGGTLAGQRLTLRLSAGPCSDGMSDTVYPFSVVRRLGADEQRGCARPD